MESAWRGASGMDAARGVQGPWMALVRRPPERGWNEGSRAQRDPDGGARLFGSFWGDCQKELAQQGETLPSANSITGMHPVAGFGRPPYGKVVTQQGETVRSDNSITRIHTGPARFRCRASALHAYCTRGSLGIPSARSAMMLRWISLLPP